MGGQGEHVRNSDHAHCVAKFTIMLKDSPKAQQLSELCFLLVFISAQKVAHKAQAQCRSDQKRP